MLLMQMLFYWLLNHKIWQAVLEEIKGSINPTAVVITFAAGKTISFISNGLGTSNPVVRVMPNTPTLVGARYGCSIDGTRVLQLHNVNLCLVF